MIKGGAGVSCINDSEGDLSAWFFPFMCDVKSFHNSMLEPFIFKPSRLEKAIIFRHFLSNVKSKLQYFLHFNSRNR